MKKIENECISCDVPPCLGDSCPNKNVVRYYCDCCGSEEKLYYYDDFELCQDCLLKNFDVVEGSDW